MNPDDFGPFANVMAIVSALLAVFSFLAVRVVGKANTWTWMSDNPPKALAMVPARVIAIVVIAAAYLLIDPGNYIFFLIVALGFALVCAWAIATFDRLRRTHVAEIRETADDGSPAVDDKGKPVVDKVIIGTEATLRSEAATALAAARQDHGGVSLVDFMAGYGSPPNRPAALWDTELLAGLGAKLTGRITITMLSGPLAVFLAALAIDAAG